MSDDLLDKGQRDRSHIAVGQPHEVQYWTGTLASRRMNCSARSSRWGISAAAVRKELGLLGRPHR